MFPVQLLTPGMTVKPPNDSTRYWLHSQPGDERRNKRSTQVINPLLMMSASLGVGYVPLTLEEIKKEQSWFKR